MEDFQPQSVAEILFRKLNIDESSQFLIAYSGGMDSTALLHAVAGIFGATGADRVTALHCNHGIHPDSNDWEAHCAEMCAQFGVGHASVRLDLGREGPISEGRAREARYAWFREQIGDHGVLLTAHHQADQAETLILNLVRGASLRGISAIQPVSEFGKGLLVRPMLGFDRDQIAAYVERKNLAYIDDPANQDLRHSRNYVRSQVMPAIENRWPSAAKRIANSAKLLSQARHALDELAMEDMSHCVTRGRGYFSEGDQLLVESIRELSRFRQVNMLRYWIRTTGFSEPEQKMLDNFIDRVVLSDSGSGQMCWNECSLRKYKGALYLARTRRLPDSDEQISWDLKEPLEIASAGIRLSLVPAFESGFLADLLPKTGVVRFRRGGEQMTLGRCTHSTKLKKILNQAEVPAWERSILPLIYFGDELAAVAPLAVSAHYSAGPGQEGLRIRLESI